MSRSVYVWLFTAALAILALFQDRPWKPLEVFDWDGGGYYAYLPSAFIYHNLGRADSLDRLVDAQHPGRARDLGLVHLPNGNVISKYPLGVALADVPWFLGAHLYAHLHGDPTNGFSRPYQQIIVLAGLCYAMLGLWIIRLLLRRYYDDRVTAWVLACIGLGTNVLAYATYDAQMAHAHLLMWQAALLYCTARWYETFRLRFAVGIGLFLGLAMLTRPTEALYALVPLCWGLGLRTIGPRLEALRQHVGQIVVAGLLAGAVASLQFVFWRVTSGHWLLYSYGEESFDFLHPHLIDGLLSFRKGWFVYTPLAVVALLGVLVLRRYVAAAVSVLLVLVPVVLYVTFSWTQWWYGGGYSARPLISLYPLLALPLAALVAMAYRQRRLALLGPVLGLFIVLNLWQTWQYAAGILLFDNNTRELYFSKFFDTSLR